MPTATKPLTVGQILEHVDLRELRELAAHQLQAGLSPEQVAQDIARLIDALLPLDVMIAGPVGAMLEQLDRPLLLLICRPIVRAARQAAAKAAK